MNKGMPFWEQHLEKMVLGLSVVVLLAVFAMMVLGTADITAEIDGRTYGASEVDDVMVQKAQELGSRLSPEATADVSAFDAIDGSGAGGFRDRLTAGVSPSSRLPRVAPALAASLLPEEVGSVDVWYYEPSLDAPQIRSQVVQTIDTIDPSEFDRVAELSSLAKANGDVVWTTPVATLDLDGIRRELAAQTRGTTPPRNAIPSNWYNERPYILDIVFERETLGVDGSWGDLAVVSPPPGTPELRSQIVKAKDEDALNASFKQFVWLNLDDRVQQLELLQPDFYATLNDRLSIGDLESTATDVESTSVDASEAAAKQEEAELRRRIKDRVSSASRLEATLDELGGPLREEEDTGAGAGGSAGRGGGSGRGSGRGGGGGPPGGDPNGGGAGFGSGAGRKTGSSDGSAADKRRRIALTLKLERMKAEIKRLQEQLAELDPNAGTIDLEMNPGTSLPDLAVADEILVWTHDLAVEQGATYRYRCRAVTFNPFFARGRQLLPDQQSLAESFGLSSATSDWSAPVTINPPVEFFAVKASDSSGSLGMGEARFELYSYTDGALRSELFTVEPGERIGRAATVGGRMVDFTTDWYLVDVIADPAAPEGPGLDQEENATVICRRLDGTEIRIRVPSSQQADPRRAGLRIDVASSADQG
jgi:hypothetical protein